MFWQIYMMVERAQHKQIQVLLIQNIFLLLSLFKNIFVDTLNYIDVIVPSIEVRSLEEITFQSSIKLFWLLFFLDIPLLSTIWSWSSLVTIPTSVSTHEAKQSLLYPKFRSDDRSMPYFSFLCQGIKLELSNRLSRWLTSNLRHRFLVIYTNLIVNLFD